MRTLDATGKSIDEAIYNGLHELEISIDEVDIEILQQESKGVLGFGAKPAIVRLIERDPADVIIPEYLTEEARMQRAERADSPRPRRDRDGRDRRGPRRDDRRRDTRDGYAPRESGREGYAPRESMPRESGREGYAPRESMPRETPAKPAVEYSAEAAADNPAAIFLKGLLTQMGVEGEVLANVTPATQEEVSHIRLCIRAEHMGVLIGHRGETLDALQYLTSLCVNRARKAQGYTRVTIDTEGYRDKREETLTRLARKVASQVKATGRSRTMEPMNPYERRVLHATLQSHPYVTTHSEGEEPFRRVVVEPKSR